MKKTALIFGSTGFVGSYLLNDLLHDEDYGQVIAVSRRALETSHPKLRVLLGDFQSLEGLRSQLVADDVFVALGTTTAATPDRTKYYQIDHDYPVLAAKIAKENGAKSIFVVSAIGANAKSKLFYVRTKGEMERDILALDFPYMHIFRPSMIIGNRKEHRPIEKLFIRIWPIIDSLLLGPLNRYRGIEAKLVARAMLRAAKRTGKKVNVYPWAGMTKL